MKHISKRGLGIAAIVAIAGSVLVGPSAVAGGSDNRAHGRATYGADQIRIKDVKGDRDEARGSFRLRSGGHTAYGTPLCVTGTEDGPGKTVAIAMWINRSNFPASSPFAQGKFGIEYVQDKSGPDASRFVPAPGPAVTCPAQGFAFPGGLLEVDGDYDVKVKD